MAFSTRLSKELEMLKKSPKPYFELLEINGVDLYCKIILPENCKFNVKKYDLHLKFPENYPFKSPTIQFIEKVEPETKFIDNNKTVKCEESKEEHGNVCSDYIKKTWGPTVPFIKVVEEVYNLLMSR